MVRKCNTGQIYKGKVRGKEAGMSLPVLMKSPYISPCDPHFTFIISITIRDVARTPKVPLIGFEPRYT